MLSSRRAISYRVGGSDRMCRRRRGQVEGARNSRRETGLPRDRGVGPRPARAYPFVGRRRGGRLGRRAVRRSEISKRRENTCQRPIAAAFGILNKRVTESPDEVRDFPAKAGASA